MSKAHPPELKKFMDKKLSLRLNGGRCVQGMLWGFDPFINLVLVNVWRWQLMGNKNIGMVVIRGNNVSEALEQV
uniref:Sm domain-containing protein n=1 Tax=Ailuropoda melanoleuca TaxID=9646 RepID=A0A7N5K2V9_AILME